MFFDLINRIRHTLAFRLTLWYAVIFIASAAIVFVLFYMQIAATIERRIDGDLRRQRSELSRVYALQGIAMVQRSAAFFAQSAGEKKVFFRLFYDSGVVFSSSNMNHWKEIGIDRNAVDTVLAGNSEVIVTHYLSDPKTSVRVIYARIGKPILLQLGVSLEEGRHWLQAFRQIFVVTMSGILLLAVLAGWFMARRALSGVGHLTHTARQISAEDLDARVPVSHHHSEIDMLARTFNQMLDRVQVLVTGVRQMNDNIAHDLRSPITRIRGLAEITLTGAQDLDAYRQMSESTIEECDRLLEMINTMLAISRTEAGVNARERKLIDFSTLVQDACNLFQPLAEDKSITLLCNTEADINVSGDRPMLQRLVANLVDNALKYTDAGGTIRVILHGNADNAVRLEINDSGMGISPDEMPKIFDRFYRGDRSRTQSGTGLGLSLAQVIARSHGGHLLVQSDLGKGSTFTLELPVVAPDVG
jgi:heavy metal sensor kinase